MQSDLCFTIDDAMRSITRALGGAKAVGIRLRPEFGSDLDAAGRWWLDCINPERKEKASLEQVMCVLRWAHDAGCHDGMNYIARDCGYREPDPVTPEQEKDDLTRKLTSAIGDLKTIWVKAERAGLV